VHIVNGGFIDSDVDTVGQQVATDIGAGFDTAIAIRSAANVKRGIILWGRARPERPIDEDARTSAVNHDPRN